MAYEMNDFKTIDDVIKYLGQFKKPYVALEGSRTITHEAAEKMEKIAKILVTALPNLIVRSGNAEGSDIAWARGVNSVAPERLELFVPQKNMPKKNIVTGNRVITISDINPDFWKYAKKLSCENYLSVDGKKFGKSAWDKIKRWQQPYLIRDVFKVTGVPFGKEKPIKTHLALLYINTKKKNGGGTGHTMRICERLGVPVIGYETWKDY
ncbi:MAG TPA: hypothetical protein DCQ99_10105 [Nitrospinae bacterium]|nr:hypothetical protein [Nitrospinota bacterium]HBA27023.1 hypothetical protein [Nitrospinota bacterium]